MNLLKVLTLLKLPRVNYIISQWIQIKGKCDWGSWWVLVSDGSFFCTDQGGISAKCYVY